MAESFKFEITQPMGVLSQGKGGWNMELNMVSWNDRPPKYDIRGWNADHTMMRKGVSLTKEELVALKSLLDSITLS